MKHSLGVHKTEILKAKGAYVHKKRSRFDPQLIYLGLMYHLWLLLLKEKKNQKTRKPHAKAVPGTNVQAVNCSLGTNASFKIFNLK